MEATGSEFRESTAPLLRPPQVADIQQEVDRMKGVLSGPRHVTAGVDLGEMQRQVRKNLDMLKTAPRPYNSAVIDDALARAKTLQEKIEIGMPTAAEMRRNPPGAVDKHRAWEKRYKTDILEWKNVRLRLHASGALDDSFPEDSQDVANIEMFRPIGGAQEMDLSVAQIERPVMRLPPAGTEASVTVMTPERESALKAFDPKLHASVATLNNDQRVLLFGFIDELIAATDRAVDDKKSKARKSA